MSDFHTHPYALAIEQENNRAKPQAKAYYRKVTRLPNNVIDARYARESETVETLLIKREQEQQALVSTFLTKPSERAQLVALFHRDLQARLDRLSERFEQENKAREIVKSLARMRAYQDSCD